MRTIVFIFFLIWLCATSVVLLTPAETVRQTGSSVRRQPSVKIHRQTVAFKTVNDGGTWHLFWFFGLASTAALLQRKPTLAASAKVFLILSAYGIGTELIQETLIPGRSFEWRDLGMNTIGIAAGITIIIASRRFLNAVLKC